MNKRIIKVEKLSLPNVYLYKPAKANHSSFQTENNSPRIKSNV